MKQKQDITQMNTKDEYHGYQEWYWDKIWLRGVYKHGDEIGYKENHRVKLTIFSIR